MAERADDRLVRLLGIVAYLDGAGPVPVGELARHFGVSERQVLDDVDALWVSGTPGYWPDDLIDFDADSIERGVVRLTEARGMTRPLRLGTREAVALIAALRAMRETAAVQADPERAGVVESVLRKLTDATGEAAAALDVQLAPEGDPRVVAAITSALVAGHRLRIRYVTAADEESEREVDPVSLHTQDEHAYLLAWCHRARGRRTFRVDRILAATELDQPVEGHDVDPDVDFTPTGDAPLATITFASPARAVAEQVPVESVRNLPDGAFEVRLRVTNPVWLRQPSPSGRGTCSPSSPRRSRATCARPRAPPCPRTRTCPAGPTTGRAANRPATGPLARVGGMWFWVWTLLVVGTLVGAFFLARHLWRSVKGLGRELSRASQVAADMSARADELSRALEEAQPSTAPTLFDDPVVLQERVDLLRAERAERRAQRRRRDEQVWSRWRRFNA